jgi:hypothetical protein
MKPTILFVQRVTAAVLETIPVAKRIQQDGIFSVAYLVDSPTAAAQVPLLLVAGITALHPSGREYTEAPQQSSEAKSKITPKNNNMKERVFALIPSFIKEILNGRSRLKRARSLLSSNHVAAIAISGDRLLGWEITMIKAGHDLGIKSVITPYALNYRDSIAENRLRSRNFETDFRVKGIHKRFIALLFPQWAHTYKSMRLFFHPVTPSLAAWFLGTMSKNPWISGGGHADMYAIESGLAKGTALKEGVSEEKVVVTGKPSVDDLADLIHSADLEELRKDYGIPEGNKVVLCAVPQLGEHGLLPWDKHMQETEFLFEQMSALPDTSVLLSLHPKMDPENYKKLAAQYGAQIPDARVYSLLPLCHVFVATASSIVVQAIAISKPSVVVDFSKLDPEDFYVGSPGVTTLWDREKLYPTLEKLLTDDVFYKQQQAAQGQEGDKWALLDGKCTERVTEEIYKLTEGVF